MLDGRDFNRPSGSPDEDQNSELDADSVDLGIMGVALSGIAGFEEDDIPLWDGDA
jgi:hypothetical protein